MRRPRIAAAVLFGLIGSTAIVDARDARADGGAAPATGSGGTTATATTGSSSSGPPPTLETADSSAACSALVARSEREAAAWDAAQRPVPYRYPRQERILGAPWVSLGRAAGEAAGVIAATLVPNIGVALRSTEPEAGISFPLQVPLGPALSCSRAAKAFDVAMYRPFRLIVEPGFLLSDRGVALFVRPGARFIYHPTSWVVGAGGGFGSMIELSSAEPTRASLSPELVLQLGSCCEPGYATLAFRREIFFEGRTQIWFASAGFTYF